jgi:glyoxylate reductase
VKIVVSAPLPGPAVDALRADHEVIVGESERGLGRDALIALARIHSDTAGLVTLLTDRVDAVLLDAFPSLRVIGNYAVGVDNVDLAACAARNVVVCNTPDVLTDATADLTMALLLAIARRVPEGERLVREGQWEGWSPWLLLGTQVTGATLGIVGFGRIGRAVARRAAGFGMTVLATSEHLSDASIENVPLDTLLARSDFVTLHVPLTDRTRGIIDARALARMKPGAFLINTARGPLVDEPALAAALVGGRIAGAALDVFADEPRVHPSLLAAPNTLLVPHIGSASRVAREGMARLACGGVADVLAGRAPANRVG